MLDRTFINPNQENTKPTEEITSGANTVDKVKAAGVVAITGAATIGGITMFTSANANEETTIEDFVKSPIPTASTEVSATDDCQDVTTPTDDVTILNDGSSSSFTQAFADARRTLGDNATFEWNGNTYNTNYAPTSSETLESIGIAVQEIPTKVSEFVESVFNTIPNVIEDTPTPRSFKSTPDLFDQAPIQSNSTDVPDLFGSTSITNPSQDVPDLFSPTTSPSASSDSTLKFGAQDSNNDGKWEAITVDRNNDGRVDIMAQDDDNDGRYDTYLIDDNNDGKIDRVIIDANHNGIDSSDAIENVSYEIEMNEYNQVQENDPMFDQFDVLGGLL